MDTKGGIMMCALRVRMDKGGYYDVEMQGWLQTGGTIEGLKDNCTKCAQNCKKHLLKHNCSRCS